MLMPWKLPHFSINVMIFSDGIFRLRYLGLDSWFGRSHGNLPWLVFPIHHHSALHGPREHLYQLLCLGSLCSEATLQFIHMVCQSVNTSLTFLYIIIQLQMVLENTFLCIGSTCSEATLQCIHMVCQLVNTSLTLMQIIIQLLYLVDYFLKQNKNNKNISIGL